MKRDRVKVMHVFAPVHLLSSAIARAKIVSTSNHFDLFTALLSITSIFGVAARVHTHVMCANV